MSQTETRGAGRGMWRFYLLLAALGFAVVPLVVVSQTTATDPVCTLSPAITNGPTPNPAKVGDTVTAKLAANPNDPTVKAECAVTKKGCTWTIDAVWFRSSMAATAKWTDVKAQWGTNVAVVPDGAEITAKMTAKCLPAGYWKVTVKMEGSWTIEKKPNVADCDCGSCKNVVKTLDVPFVVVGVEKIIVDGSEPPDSGPKSICSGTTVKLRALPVPSDATFPSGQPTWIVDAVPTGSGPTFDFKPSKAGKYSIVAQCGPNQGACGGSSTAPFIVNAVSLNKIVIAADPERPGPAILTAGNSIKLRAKITPDGAEPPSKKPAWSLGTHPNNVRPGDVTLPEDGQLEGTVKVPKPGHYIIQAAMCNATEIFHIYAYTAQLKRVTFSGTEYRTVFRDNGVAYEMPHYLMQLPQPRKNPVCYKRGSRMTLEVGADLKGVNNSEAVGTIRGKSGDTYHLPESAANYSGNAFVAKGTLEEGLPNAIDKLVLSMDYECRMRDDPPDVWNAIGSSQNGVYVTLDTPKTKLYQTFVAVGCEHAGGAMDTTTAFQGIWSAFSPKNISRTDGARLTYYDPALKVYGICKTAIGMIQQNSAPSRDGPYAIGNCIAWADFLCKCVLAQGIDGARTVTITAMNPGDGFLVEKWTFVGGPPYGFGEVPNTAVVVPGGNVVDNLGILGQSNNDPPANFNNHFIVEFSFNDGKGTAGKYWDPSYGSGPFKDDRDYEDGQQTAIKAIRKANGVQSGVNMYLVFPNTPAKELKFTP